MTKRYGYDYTVKEITNGLAGFACFLVILVLVLCSLFDVIGWWVTIVLSGLLIVWNSANRPVPPVDPR